MKDEKKSAGGSTLTTVLVAAFIVVCVILLIIINGKKADDAQPKITPDITFKTVDTEGNEWTDDCFGDSSLTVINYWAYWCSPCVSEMPDLEKLSRDYADRGVRFLGLYDEAEEEEDKKTLSELGVTYPNLRYTPDFRRYLSTVYIPVTVFLDKNGKVLGKPYIGARSYDKWAEIIEGYLQ